jgi:hypothetical protein
VHINLFCSILQRKQLCSLVLSANAQSARCTYVGEKLAQALLLRPYVGKFSLKKIALAEALIVTVK